MKYDWVDNNRRYELIARVARGEKIIAVAKELDINYGNAKSIISSERKYRLKTGPMRQRRRPRFQKLFVVETIKSRKVRSMKHRPSKEIPTYSSTQPSAKPTNCKVRIDFKAQTVQVGVVHPGCNQVPKSPKLEPGSGTQGAQLLEK